MAAAYNPFLFDADPAAAAAPAAAAINPFLSDFGAPAAAAAPPADNPFFNPFGAPAPAAPAPPTGTNAFLFSSAPEPAAAANPFASFIEPPAPAAAAPETAMDLIDTSMPEPPPPLLQVDNSPPGMAPCPPGTATVPPTTKELLDCVTGALEATSDSLMDRLNQPSPVNLIPSPSPSPRSPSPDLLMGDDAPPVPPPSANIMGAQPSNDVFDTPLPPPGPKTTTDILGLYAATAPAPKVEAAPAPPPPPPVAVETATLIDTTEPPPPPPAPIVVAPPVPPAPVVAAPPPRPPPVPEPPATVEAAKTPVTVLSPATEAVPPPPVPAVVSSHPQTPEIRSPAVEVAPLPERPKPPTVPSPVHEPKPSPSRPPPPPVPPAPRAQPSPTPPRPAPPVARPPPPMVPSPTRELPALSPVAPEIAKPELASIFGGPLPTAAKVPAPPSPEFEPPHANFSSIFGGPPAAPAVPEPPVQSRPETAAIFAGSTPAATAIFGAPPEPPKPRPVAAFAPPAPPPARQPPPVVPRPAAAFATPAPPAFDDFDAKFNATSDAAFGSASTGGSAFGDAFGASATTATSGGGDAWGSSTTSSGFGDSAGNTGFGGDTFDSFLSLKEPPPVPQSTPAKSRRDTGDDDDAEQDLSVIIRPKTELSFGLAPALAPPPPKSPAISTNSAFSEDSDRNFVPFLSTGQRDTTYDAAIEKTQLNRTDSQETPQTPLYEEDQSQPLEEFPRTKFDGEGWEMHMRHPNKKNIMGQRFWKNVYVKIVVQNDVPIVHIYSKKGDKDPFQEIPLQPCYSVSDIGAQQFDQYGKIFTVKLQYIFYKEKAGIRPGQIAKAGRISDKLSQFAAYAIVGDVAGVKEFGSDLKKLGLPLEHAPQISQLAKLGTQNYEDLKQFSMCIEEALFKLNVHRDRAIQYKTEEIQTTIVDEYYVEQDIYGIVTRQIARVRVFFLSFLSGVAEVEMGINDLRRQGKEIVGRHDIMPIATEEWIRTEDIEFSNCVQLDEFDKTKTIKFKPPDACYLELLRFRVRPPKRRELPLQVKTVFTTTGQKIEIRSDILVPGFISRKLGQIPCEDVMVRFPIPESWIYMFRVEKHFRYGSVKSAHRRSGKVKGIERFLGAVDAVEPSLMEVTSGQAKYEHQHRAIVWRIPRLPKEGQGAYTTHSFFCHVHLQAHEQIPDNLSKYCYVEFNMPHTTVSHTVCRSIAVPTCDEPPEKCVKYLARHEYVVEIEFAQGYNAASYTLAAATTKETKEEEKPRDKTENWFPEEKPKADDDSDFSD